MAGTKYSLTAIFLLYFLTPCAHAGFDPAITCEATRLRAAGKYMMCQQKGIATEFKKPSPTGQGPYSKCRTKYASVWTKLQGKATLAGTVCEGPRFVDNGNGTFTDNLTALQWEQKTNLDGTANFADPHDADNTYSWCADVVPPIYGCDNGPVADGTAFTDFFPQLNGARFAGSCDWRLPTFAEIESLLAGPYPCGTSPCIDPVAGPTAADYYWSGTIIVPGSESAWSIGFADGSTAGDVKGHPTRVRAVRGGY